MGSVAVGLAAVGAGADDATGSIAGRLSATERPIPDSTAVCGGGVSIGRAVSKEPGSSLRGDGFKSFPAFRALVILNPLAGTGGAEGWVTGKGMVSRLWSKTSFSLERWASTRFRPYGCTESRAMDLSAGATRSRSPAPPAVMPDPGVVANAGEWKVEPS